MPKKDDDIRPPLTKKDEERIREVLKEAQIKPADHFQLPKKPSKSPMEPGKKINPAVPEGRILENYNGQKGDGTFKEFDFNWQPGCGEPFGIELSEAWTPPPAGLANKFDGWAEFATFRAILICLKNQKCRRVHPLGCYSTWEIKFANGEVYARAYFVFECVET
jgi:hypothetical protein